jgi:hypothetical protein
MPSLCDVTPPPSKKKKAKDKSLTKEEEHKGKFFYLLKSSPEKFLKPMYLLIQKLEKLCSMEDNDKKMKKINLLP